MDTKWLIKRLFTIGPMKKPHHPSPVDAFNRNYRNYRNYRNFGPTNITSLFFNIPHDSNNPNQTMFEALLAVANLESNGTKLNQIELTMHQLTRLHNLRANCDPISRNWQLLKMMANWYNLQLWQQLTHRYQTEIDEFTQINQTASKYQDGIRQLLLQKVVDIENDKTNQFPIENAVIN